ncbi:MAG: SCP2 sterol-binding domain-containing protein [Coriobacteriia bacterium]|nr:SCP2 sterol-binding domain-containing protein [Coriobacteriia bacterium]
MLKQFLIERMLKQRKKAMHVDEDYSVQVYLEKIPQYFDAEKAGTRCLTVVYEIHDSGSNDGVWTVTIADGQCAVSSGEPEQYDTLLYMTAETYRRILTGQMEISKMPYSTGAVRFFGNSFGHQELNTYVTISKDAGIAAI